MSTCYTTLCGIYPKLIRSKEVPHLKKSLHAYDAKKLSSEDLEDVYKANACQILSEQREAGITVLSDGLIRWNDFFSPFCEAWEGLERVTLKRVYDTNTLQRHPRVTGPVIYKQSKATDDASYCLSLLQKNERLKTTLPGPLTFADACEDLFYKDIQKLSEALAIALNQELKALKEKDISIVELYEPSLHFEEWDTTLIKNTYKLLLQDITDIDVLLGSFYGNYKQQYIETINALPLAGINFDCIHSACSLQDYLTKQWKIVQLGVFDARTTRDDNLDRVKQIVRSAQDLQPESEIWLSLNNSTEFLPRDRAIRKASRLQQLLS